MAITRTRSYDGPALFSYGFRPFFLFGAIYTAVAMAAWIMLLSGRLETFSHFAPVDWHAHEMLFGYLAAIIAGFLLTAIPNWTGRLPLNGAPLAALFLAWLAGRVAIFFSAAIGPLPAAAIDCAFLALLAAAAAREIVAGRNWRNLKVLVPILVLIAANALFHAEVATAGTSDFSRRAGIAAAIMLIGIIGGRIIPSFTRNWLAKRSPHGLPAPFGRFDAACLTLTAVALAGWTVAQESTFGGWMALAAAAANLVRLARWRGDRCAGDFLVFILHLGFLWVPIGMLLAGMGALMPDRIVPAGAVHAFGVGGIGTMTLAVMVRATLGHTGRELAAGWRGSFVFAAILLAAAARVMHALFWPSEALLHLSATAWIAAFLGFASLFGPFILSPRLK